MRYLLGSRRRRPPGALLGLLLLAGVMTRPAAPQTQAPGVSVTVDLQATLANATASALGLAGVINDAVPRALSCYGCEALPRALLQAAGAALPLSCAASPLRVVGYTVDGGPTPYANISQRMAWSLPPAAVEALAGVAVGGQAPPAPVTCYACGSCFDNLTATLGTDWVAAAAGTRLSSQLVGLNFVVTTPAPSPSATPSPSLVPPSPSRTPSPSVSPSPSLALALPLPEADAAATSQLILILGGGGGFLLVALVGSVVFFRWRRRRPKKQRPSRRRRRRGGSSRDGDGSFATPPAKGAGGAFPPGDEEAGGGGGARLNPLGLALSLAANGGGGGGSGVSVASGSPPEAALMTNPLRGLGGGSAVPSLPFSSPPPLLPAPHPQPLSASPAASVVTAAPEQPHTPPSYPSSAAAVIGTASSSARRPRVVLSRRHATGGSPSDEGPKAFLPVASSSARNLTGLRAAALALAATASHQELSAELSTAAPAGALPVAGAAVVARGPRRPVQPVRPLLASPPAAVAVSMPVGSGPLYPPGVSPAPALLAPYARPLRP